MKSSFFDPKMSYYRLIAQKLIFFAVLHNYCCTANFNLFVTKAEVKRLLGKCKKMIIFFLNQLSEIVFLKGLLNHLSRSILIIDISKEKFDMHVKWRRDSIFSYCTSTFFSLQPGPVASFSNRKSIWKVFSPHGNASI